MEEGYAFVSRFDEGTIKSLNTLCDGMDERLKRANDVLAGVDGLVRRLEHSANPVHTRALRKLRKEDVPFIQKRLPLLTSKVATLRADIRQLVPGNMVDDGTISVIVVRVGVLNEDLRRFMTAIYDRLDWITTADF